LREDERGGQNIYNHHSVEHEMWGSSGSNSRQRNRSSSARGQSSRASTVNEAAVLKMFSAYADDEEPNVATMEGICKLAEDIDIDPMEDRRILVLLWKLGAKEKPAQISKQEWSKGCAKLQIDSIDKVKALLPSLDTGFLLEDDFKDFYKFTFQFNREGTHRTLDKELVIGLLKMVLEGRVDEERLSSFAEFLEQLSGEANSRVTLDQWTSFLEFCIECKDIETDYDEDTSAWPVLLDEYVEYMKSRH